MIKLLGKDLYPGQTVYCKLTGKQLIIQRLHYKTGVNPQYTTQEREVEKITVRYLSQKHDEFKTTDVYLFEIETSKPENIKNNNHGKFNN